MTVSLTGLPITTNNFLRLREMMEYSIPLNEELEMLEDRQDLSQYSYDPEDRLETVTFPDSQQSSQASDKTDVFLGHFDSQKSADDIEDVLAFLQGNNETQPVMSEDTGDDELRFDVCTPGVNVTGWLVDAEEVAQVSTSREVPSVLWLEDACPQTFEVQVLKTSCFITMTLLLIMDARSA